MKEKVLIIGAGGHARSVLDIALENNEYEIMGCLDPVYPERTSVEHMEDIPVIGTDADMQRLYESGIKHIFIAIGSNKIRDNLLAKAIKIGFMPINIISSYARVSPRAKLGKGICVMAGAVLSVNCKIGDNCIINTNCSLDHDCIIGKSVHIAPGVTLSGCVNVGEGTQIGTGTSVIEGMSIGSWSFVGCGSAVVSNLEDHCLAYGNPAKKIREIE